MAKGSASRKGRGGKSKAKGNGGRIVTKSTNTTTPNRTTPTVEDTWTVRSDEQVSVAGSIPHPEASHERRRSASPAATEPLSVDVRIRSPIESGRPTTSDSEDEENGAQTAPSQPTPKEHSQTRSAALTEAWLALAYIRNLYQQAPEMFLEPTRANLMTLGSAPHRKIELDKARSLYIVKKPRAINVSEREDEEPDNGEEGEGTGVKSKTQADMDVMYNKLDYLCRQNQVVFHSQAFLMDSILQAFSGCRLTAREFGEVRQKGQAYHTDFQNRFLWLGLLPWCEKLTANNPALIDLCRNVEGEQPLPDNFEDQLRKVLIPHVNKITFTTVWSYAPIVDYETTFKEPSLTIYWFRIILITLVPYMVKLLAVEKDTPSRQRSDLNFRNTIRQEYRLLGFYEHLKNVEFSLFHFNHTSRTKRNRFGRETQKQQVSNRWNTEFPPTSEPAG